MEDSPVLTVMLSGQCQANPSPWVEFGLDPTGLNYVRMNKASSLVFEGVNGTMHLRMDWTPEARESRYPPSNGKVTMEAVVAGLIVWDLMEVALGIARSKTNGGTVDIHASLFFTLSIEASNNAVTVKLLEDIEPVKDFTRTVGVIRISRYSFLSTVADSVERFLKLLVSENPSLARHKVAMKLLEHVKILRAASNE